MSGLILFSAGLLQAQVSRESDLKAAYIFNFVQFVEWPSNGFRSATSPFKIGVMGDDFLAGALTQLTRNETVGRHKLEVERCTTIDQGASCHILYIGRAELPRLPEILAGVANKQVLTIGDGQDFSDKGGVIALFTQRNRLRFSLNVAAAERQGLRISSKLQRLAENASPRRTR